MAGTDTRAPLAARAWRAMFEVLMKSAPLRTRALARRGLTPNDSRALFSLDPGPGRTMRSLADEWRCDPSNATWIVDRLETLGLAERRAVPHDRRVKLVALTPKGARTRAALMRDFYRPPAELAALDRGDLQALDRILAKIASAGPVHDPPRESRRPAAPSRRARLDRRER
jgi:DNA-binding MarR family transcriptional regulator